ncbi:hypothetical protein COU58_02985 [Candidatus Pacearchaeota archaeon CG10_big_fil_rev_8_21_14_0_10_32_42]|nr:MAG: hypothetical protein COU58_02985 [Candidatus Pacearchaeota archaeon CG10_big_fil_rev_8_21_14_0_10_32_42]
MVKIDKDQLEKALTKDEPKLSKEEEIGYHKGAVTTLINERNELIKMAQVVEQIMQVHVKRLEEIGVKIQKK